MAVVVVVMMMTTTAGAVTVWGALEAAERIRLWQRRPWCWWLQCADDS